MATLLRLENENGAQPETPRSESAPGAPAAHPVGTGENLYLAGRPKLKSFLRYVRRHSVDRVDEAALSDRWHAANAVIRSLERDEAGAPDNPPMVKLGPEYKPLLVEFLKEPTVLYGYNTLPCDIVLVELDRLVVYQKHIDLTHARQLAARLGPSPSKEQIFRTCLPFAQTFPPVKWSRVDSETAIFLSPSNDLRFLGPMKLEPHQLTNVAPRGNLVGVFGVAVGFGSNFLNAVYAENRLILNNGSHRAYALRDIGVTHVPCLVQHVSSREELELAADYEIARAADSFLKAPRPSMLRDYFNPALRMIMPVQRRVTQIIVRFETEELTVPAL